MSGINRWFIFELELIVGGQGCIDVELGITLVGGFFFKISVCREIFTGLVFLFFNPGSFLKRVKGLFEL
ncbi:hypothetical protein AKJ65_01595 [candidate division MSBL1 archaeon SCGC-AAA259E19]|uniref:Uncharacterized protein n=1 Tax=candidate division MSBL1 archaeon SCGC-AAA259E19 TaxID=1698264 RepID=A0A133UMN1_9EURY|nr:hypothetical protein AKJ65_01595 [candidate division MSBL1 archaeon SCGC-AAA259E19]